MLWRSCIILLTCVLLGTSSEVYVDLLMPLRQMFPFLRFSLLLSSYPRQVSHCCLSPTHGFVSMYSHVDL